MDPFELSYYNCRPPLVKASATPHDFDFEDGNLFDRVLGTPNKIEIPERYIPEKIQSLGPEEEAKRSKKAAAICRILSKSSAGALAQQLRLPLVLPSRSTTKSIGGGGGVGGVSSTVTTGFDLTPSVVEGGGNKSYSNGGSTSGFSSGTNSRITSTNGSLPTSPVRRTVSIKKIQPRIGRRSGSATPSSSSRCDWSLAGVSVAPSQYISSSEKINSNNTRGRDRDRDRDRISQSSDYCSSTGYYTPIGSSSLHHHQSYENTNWDNNPSISSSSTITTTQRRSKNIFDTSEIKSKSSSYLTLATTPSHSYHSSISSTSSSDREDLLHLQHSIAREVTEKSRLVAVRALASSPGGQGLPHRYSPLRPPSPPSPTELPTIQQREGFFT